MPIHLRKRAEFVDEILYRSAYAVGAQIDGFNLPFDLSRLAVRHSSARRAMKGGYSLTLSEDWPHVIVKYLSQRWGHRRQTAYNSRIALAR